MELIVDEKYSAKDDSDRLVHTGRFERWFFRH